MPYDAMRVLLRAAMMKRQLMDIYLETIQAQSTSRLSRSQQRAYQRIRTDVSHAYVVVSQLYANVERWRAMHAHEMVVPTAAASLGLDKVTNFIENIASKADHDAYAITDFPERNTTHRCRWSMGLHSPNTGDADDDISDLPNLFAMEDDDSYEPDQLFADEADASCADDDADALFADDDVNDDDDDDYPYFPDAGATDGAAIMPSDGYDVYFGWGMASHHRDGMPDRLDFACADMGWHQPDPALPSLTDHECRKLFGVYVVPPQPKKKAIYDIFGNIIGWLPVDDDSDADDPDYNVPGSM